MPDVPDVLREPVEIGCIDQRPDVVARRQHDAPPRRPGQVDELGACEFDALALLDQGGAHHSTVSSASAGDFSSSGFFFLLRASAASAAALTGSGTIDST